MDLDKSFKDKSVACLELEDRNPYSWTGGVQGSEHAAERETETWPGHWWADARLCNNKNRVQCSFEWFLLEDIEYKLQVSYGTQH